MSNDPNLNRIAIAMNLEGCTAQELREFATTLTTTGKCVMGDVCFHGNSPWEPHAAFINREILVGCREDLEQVAKWEQTETAIVLTKALWARIDQLAAEKQRAEEERKKTERERYRRYLIAVRKMNPGQINDELIDRELAEKKTTPQKSVQIRRIFSSRDRK